MKSNGKLSWKIAFLCIFGGFLAMIIILMDVRERQGYLTINNCIGYFIGFFFVASFLLFIAYYTNRKKDD